MLLKRGINLVASVKICGLTSLEMLQSIAHLPIDQIGFMFAPSKRQVTPKLAGEMIAFLHGDNASGTGHSDVIIKRQVPETVGVFVRPTKQQLMETIALAPIDVIQLHSEETADYCRWIKNHFGLKIYKVISVAENSDSQQQLALLEPYVEWIDAILLDTYDPLIGGGTGKVFAWHCIPDYLQWTRRVGLKLIVAGGLNPLNVAQWIAEYHPDGVDVSSGVETDGFKDAVLIKSFVERVKGL